MQDVTDSGLMRTSRRDHTLFPDRPKIICVYKRRESLRCLIVESKDLKATICLVTAGRQ